MAPLLPFQSAAAQKVNPSPMTRIDMPQWPRPNGENELAECLDELDAATAVSEWEGAVFTAGVRTGKGASAKKVAVAAAAGAVGGGVGGKVGLSTVAKVESMAASNDVAGHVGRTTQAAMQQGGKIVEPSTSAGQKVGQTAADTASSYVEKRVNK